MGKNVDVLLTESVFALGGMGEIVSVKRGYARNFLLPQGKGILADRAAKRQVEALQERAARQEAESLEQAESQAKKIKGLKVTVAAKVSHDTHLFGSVGIREVVHALGELGYNIDAKHVQMHEAIKELGSYQIPLRLYRGVEESITLQVVDSDPEGKDMQEVLEEAGIGDEAPGDATPSPAAEREADHAG